MKINIEKIRLEMDKQGLNPPALASKMGKKESWIYEILAGRQGKTFVTLEKLAEALGTDPKDLLS
uniref:Putative DNA binding, helix-turn-helix domain containing protein n=1 Tax=viral metagenome TaxID=1070528 RepID=A0A6H2A6C1_9ZZZZ